ncbi:hypothetical protein JDV02_004666 [Purpureocillium takamizusanense]|uniref:Xylanolytic transcriptional activator regulatory domain-containing protein n=1 Tax=Purpureocillium takamizusanense TaxID=2060973 RepID=A0A9Q8V9M1_9HYPO|nr:uncharacterized protein JDV02_004666 [Purpureocillium takamizusanense]UNI18395.1 hypothetical protein JDV02_004666 [Purpureocillium takamizusanense]
MLTANNETSQAHGQNEARRVNRSATFSNQEAIVEMLSALQDQLDSLASRVQTPNRDQPLPPSPALAAESSSQRDYMVTPMNDGGTGQGGLNAARQASRAAASQNFYGPTSPDYALNVAQLKVRQNSCSDAPLQQQQLQLASIDQEDTSDDEDTQGAQDARFVVAPRALDRRDPARLLVFRSVMGLHEVMRLLYVYQEVVGDLHPIIDLDELITQTQSWYADADPGVWKATPDRPGAASDERLLILNLALAIALRADSKPLSCDTESLLRESFQDAVNAKLASPAYNIKHVTIVLLKGWHDVFHDMPRSAWRLCGIAGRMLMELGFHNGDVSNHTLDSEARRTEAYSLMSSIVILDRQWSSTTGLPTHFHESSFNSIPPSYVKNPYLRAMLSFILISDQFSEPILQAAKGERYNDEDAFELMNFQIEQWRKKAVGEHSLDRSEKWQTNPSSRPPTWTILLNLRAESVRSLLLKPFFFSESDLETTKKHLRPATELVYNVVNVLYTLDSTTDIYRKQHPYFQHLLASAVGLAFLLIAFIKQNKSTLLASLAPDLAESVSRSFEMAASLTARYTRVSRSARRLSKRLSEMTGILLDLGVLNNPSSGGGREFTRPNEQESVANTARSIRRTSLAHPPSQSCPEYSPPLSSRPVGPRGFGIGLPTTSGPDVQLEWEDSLRLQWPSGDISNMFSESIF